MIGPAVPACSRGAGVAADACCCSARAFPGSAGLAGRAPEGDPVVLSGRTDRRPAPAARLAPAAVDPVLLAPAHAARGDVAEPFLVRLEQPPGQFGQRAEVGHAARRLPRADAA